MKKSKANSSTKKTASPAEDKKSLSSTLAKALLLIQQVRSVEKDITAKIDGVEKKLTKAKTEKDKMNYVLEIEALRFNFYKVLEKEYQELSPLFGDIYDCATRIGGPVSATLDVMYNSISKGIDLALLEKQCEQMQKQL